ncbi:MAG: efflux RND transporter periplasmic adaptor subunit [Burkholderiaceae bacterium]
MTSNAPWTRRLVLGTVALAVLGGIAFVMVRSGPLAPVKVTVARVDTGHVSPAVFGLGTVEARRSWMVGPTAAGRVLRVAVDVGDTVAPGQLLADMDPVDLDQRLVALDASLARARSAQTAAQAQVLDATARQQLSAGNLRRNEDLARQAFISPGALEGRQQELASANAALQTSQANATGTGQDLQRLAAERAALAQQRGNVRLLAPASGVVTTREAEPGTTVVAGQAVLRLVDPASLWVKTRIDQGRAAGLAVGQPAQVVLRSQPGQVHAATVARLELLADAVTEERLAQVAFAAPPPGVSVGELAEVTVQLPASNEGLRLPNAAIQRQAGQAGVWKLGTDGKPVWVPVTLGASGLDGTVRVDSEGLADGDRVVQHSQKPLQAGMRVQVVDALVPGTSQGPAK